MGSRTHRPALALLAALTAALALTGCVSMASAGPVISYPVTQQTGGQNGQNLQVIAKGPSNGWQPKQIVTGFLTAAAAFGNSQVAKEYLTPQASKTWNPSWNAYVYSNGPIVENPVLEPTGSQPTGSTSGTSSTSGTNNNKAAKKTAKPQPERAMVVVDGKIQASLSGHGTYAAPSASTPGGPRPQFFELVLLDGQWRISSAPRDLLLTQGQFTDDYELRNLYFFDPNARVLVPDPVYVPLQATTGQLMTSLVYDLHTPPKDWLGAGATQTAFPPGIKVANVTVAGQLATVDLSGAMTNAQKSQVSAQLLWTLVGSGQGSSQVESVQLVVNGKPYPQGNPVQNQSQASYQPASGASSAFYYLNSAGYLVRRADATGKQVAIAKFGTKYSQIAVSPDGKYLAALRGGTLFIGLVDGPLMRRQGSGYATLSWDPNDNLWTTTTVGQIFVFRTGVSLSSRQAKPIAATVRDSNNGVFTGGPFTDLQIAPDGVRVAMIIDSSELAFGALVWEPGTSPGLGAVEIELSLFSVSNPAPTGFTSVTWYGPNNVITLGSGSILTEYPVNGGSSTSQTLDEPIQSISASAGQALIAGVGKGSKGGMADMIQAPTLTGAWTPVTVKGIPVKGVSPAYPG